MKALLDDIYALVAEIDRAAGADVQARRSECAAQARELNADVLADVLETGPSRDLRARLARPYADAARGTNALPLRPSNLKRNVFHVVSSLVAIAVLYFLPERALLIAGSIAAGSWTLELARKLAPHLNDKLAKWFVPMAHPHERYAINASTFYVTALVILAACFEARVSAMACAVLGFADPAAARLGRRFGRFTIARGRTVLGTLSFVIVGFAAAVTTGVVFGAPLRVALTLAAAAAICGALGELVAGRVDDNLTIPVSAAAGCALALAFT